MLIALLLASGTDIKKNEIPIWLFPLLSVLFIIYRFSYINWIYAIIGLMIGIVSYTIMALKFDGGGGDIIMMGSIGFILGPKILLHIACVSSICCLMYYIVKKTKTAPYAPFVTISYILCFIGGYCYGIYDYRILEIHYFLL